MHSYSGTSRYCHRESKEADIIYLYLVCSRSGSVFSVQSSTAGLIWSSPVRISAHTPRVMLAGSLGPSPSCVIRYSKNTRLCLFIRTECMTWKWRNDRTLWCVTSKTVYFTIGFGLKLKYLSIAVNILLFETKQSTTRLLLNVTDKLVFSFYHRFVLDTLFQGA